MVSECPQKNLVDLRTSGERLDLGDHRMVGEDLRRRWWWTGFKEKEKVSVMIGCRNRK